jgi:hypothetical protein
MKKKAVQHQSIACTSPFECVYADLIGLKNNTKKWDRYILAIIDTFSKWLMAIPLTRMDAETVSIQEERCKTTNMGLFSTVF